MEKQQIATIGSFCLNEACVDYQKNRSRECSEMR